MIPWVPSAPLCAVERTPLEELRALGTLLLQGGGRGASEHVISMSAAPVGGGYLLGICSHVLPEILLL